MKSRVKHIENKLGAGKRPICVRIFEFRGEKLTSYTCPCVLRHYKYVSTDECEKCTADAEHIDINIMKPTPAEPTSARDDPKEGST